MNNISIIIPTLNEAENIEVLLSHLLENSSKEIVKEILVVDCRSVDKTQDLVIEVGKKDARVKLLSSKKGRSIQMNFGAKKALGNILYFLHADSFPPKNFDQYIIQEVENNNLAGCFKMKFDSNHWWLKIAGWFTKFNHKYCRGGDQSLFINKRLFNDLKGFNNEYAICEDNEFIKKLYYINVFIVIQKSIITSARLYKRNGVLRLQYHFLIIHLKNFFGTHPRELLAYYAKHVK